MQKLILSLLVVAASLAVFGQSRDAIFVWEDKQTLASAMDPSTSLSRKIQKAWTRDSGKAYAPVPETIWATASAMQSQNETRALHYLNLAAHAGSSVLVFLILAAVLQNLGAAWLGSLFFALHPLQVEPVSYVSALPYVLGTFFALFAIWQYLAFAEASSEHHVRRKPLRHFWISTLAFALAVLTLPAAAVAAPMALVLDRLMPRKSSLMRGSRSSWPIFVWLALAVVPLFFALKAERGTWDHVAFWAKPLIAGDALSFYVSKLFVPLFLAPDYGRSPSVVLSKWWGYLTWAFPLILVGALMYWRDKARTWYMSAFTLFALGLVPFLGLLLTESQNMSVVADRYAYLAMLGPALAFAYTISMPKRTWLPLASCGALLAFVYLSSQGTKVWRNDAALWQQAMMVNSDSPIAHQAFGDLARQEHNWEKARTHYQKVLQVNAFNPQTHFALAEMEMQLGHRAKAVELYRKALALDPSHYLVHKRLGAALLAEGQLEEAREQFNHAAAAEPESRDINFHLGLVEVRLKHYVAAIPFLTKALTPAEGHEAIANANEPQAHALLGLAYANTAENIKAREELELALKLDPNHQEANHTLADIYFSEGQYENARRRYEKALISIKDNPVIYNNLGTILLEDKAYDKALSHFRTALELNPNFAEAHNSIGIAYFRLRLFNDAREHFQKAMELKAELADPYYYIGDILRWQGKQTDALAWYYRTLKNNPNHPDAHYRIGHYFMKQHKAHDAQRHFEAALKARPDDPRLRFSLRRAEEAVESAKM